jgi:hypothetical protein
MKHIPKEKWMGCAVAAAAMLADLEYDQVETHWPDLSDASLRCPRQLCNLLDSVTETHWRLSQCWHPLKSISQVAFPRWPVTVFIQDEAPRPRFAQWIVVKDEIVHDPGRWSTDTINSYPLRHWLVGWIAEPYRPEELATNQARRRLRKVRSVLPLSLESAVGLTGS